MNNGTDKKIHDKTKISSQSIRNQTIKFGQLIEYNKVNIFLQKSWIKRGKKNSSRPLFAF